MKKGKLSCRDIGMVQGYALCMTSILRNAHTSEYHDIIKQSLEDGFTFEEFKKYSNLDYNIWVDKYGLKESEYD